MINISTELPKQEEHNQHNGTNEITEKKDTTIKIDNQLPIEEYEMYSGDDFLFGKGFIETKSYFKWNPDSLESINAHLMVIGGSGSGKTRLLKQIIKYLERKQKQSYVIDFHGDITTPNETVLEFVNRDNKYGLNFFDFSTDPKYGGPKIQVDIIISLFKKNFMGKMGDLQRIVLKQLLDDCYASVGILDRDELTWQNTLPTVATLVTLYNQIIESVELGTVGHILLKGYKQIENIYFQIQDEIDDDIILKLRKKQDAIIEELEKYQKDFFTRYTDESINIDESIISNKIDMSKYSKDNILKILKGLYPYILELESSPLFIDKKLPKALGTVRYDISGLTNVEKPTAAMFFADIMVQQIFRAVKIRGEYRDKSDEYRKRRGEKVDTFIILDESKLILPTGGDKESPYNILNRIVTEARKFGLGLIIVSQRPEHFPNEIISSIFTKIILNINENDVKDAVKRLGVKPESLFGQFKSVKDGLLLFGQTGTLFKSVATPWLKINK